MQKTATRIYIVAAIVVGAYGVSYLTQAQTEPPEVEMPTWTFRELPLQLGNWQGEATSLAPEIAAATEADVIVDRLYRDDQGHAVSMHTAVFRDPAAGVYHAPTVCYRSSGWKLMDDSMATLTVSKDKSIPVRLTSWEKEGNRVLVAFWYQLGDRVLYSRADLGTLRWKWRGQPVWPAMIKVMLQIQVTDVDDPRELLLGFGERVAKWINQPTHRIYLDKWPDT